MIIKSWYYIEIIKLLIFSSLPVGILIIYPGSIIFKILQIYDFKLNIGKVNIIERLIFSFLLGLFPISLVLRIIVSTPNGYDNYVILLFIFSVTFFLLDLGINLKNYIKKKISIQNPLYYKREKKLFFPKFFIILSISLFIFFSGIHWFMRPAFWDNVSIGPTQDVLKGVAYPLFDKPCFDSKWAFRHGWTYSALILVSGTLTSNYFPLYNSGTFVIVFFTNLFILWAGYNLIKKISFTSYLPISYVYFIILLIESRCYDFLYTAKSSIFSLTLFFVGIICLYRFFNNKSLYYCILSGYILGLTYDCGLSGILFTLAFLSIITILFLYKIKEILLIWLTLGWVIVICFFMNLNTHRYLLIFYYLLISISSLVIIINLKKIKIYESINKKLQSINKLIPIRLIINNKIKCYLVLIIFIIVPLIMSINNPLSSTFFWYKKNFIFTYLFGYGILSLTLPIFLLLSFHIKNKSLIITFINTLIILTLTLPACVVLINYPFINSAISHLGGKALIDALSSHSVIYDMSRSIHLYYIPLVITIVSAIVFTYLLRFIKFKSNNYIYTLSILFLLCYIIIQPDIFKSKDTGGWDKINFTQIKLRIDDIVLQMNHLKEYTNILDNNKLLKFSCLLPDWYCRYNDDEIRLIQYLGNKTYPDKTIIFFIKSNETPWQDKMGQSFFAWDIPEQILGSIVTTKRAYKEDDFLPFITPKTLLVIHKERLADSSNLFCRYLENSLKIIYSNNTYLVLTVADIPLDKK